MATIKKTESALKEAAQRAYREHRLRGKPGETVKQKKNAFVYGILANRFGIKKKESTCTGRKMEIIVKQSSGPRMDHPSRNPDWERAVEIGKREFAKMEFRSEGEKRDYLRNVYANPNNVPGLPEFYPPVKIRSAVSGFGNMPTMACGHKSRRSILRFDKDNKQIRETLECAHGHVEEKSEEGL